MHPAPNELHQTLVTILAGATGVAEAKWDARLGEVIRLDLTRSPASNWTVAAEGIHAVALVRWRCPT
jgi:hypothetical protein